MYYLLSALALSYLCLFLLALHKVRGSGNKFTFIYGWGFIIGAWVWEDVIVFAPLFMILTIITLLVADLRFWLLGFLAFWVIRSLGETLYFFLEQFVEPKALPHNIEGHLRFIERAFGGISTQKAYILMQIMFQSMTVLSLAGVILLVTHWDMVTAWV